ncbi:unnamed protein product [Rotaria socialis]
MLSKLNNGRILAGHSASSVEPVHFFFSSHKEVRKIRSTFFLQWFIASIQLYILIFLLCTLYLGSGHNPNRYTINLDVAIVDFDGDQAGSFFLDAFRNTPPGNRTLHWRYKDPSGYSNNINDAQVDVTGGHVWAVVSLQANTSSSNNASLLALINGTSLLTSPVVLSPPVLVVYEEGRNSYHGLLCFVSY